MAKALHDLVRARANGRCEYCHLPQAVVRERFQIEHILAHQHRGDDDFDNLALACVRCNLHKGPNVAGYDPLTNALVPLFHPRRNTWREHFAWAGATVNRMTPVGRTTVAILNMNAPQRVSLRESLLDEGVRFSD